MNRITQSFLTNALSLMLKKNGWNVLFVDFPDGRRSGSGNQGKINECFEQIFDEFPDIVVTKNSTLLIVEVDLMFKQNYADKLYRFGDKKIELLDCISKKIEQKIITLEFGFGFEKKPKKNLNGYLWTYNIIKNQFELN